MLKKLNNFDKARLFWKKLWPKISTAYPFFTWEWQKAWYTTTDSKNITIYISFERETPVGIGSFSQSDNQLEWTGNAEVSDYLDLIAQKNYKTKVWEEILKDWSKEKINIIILRNIPQDSQTLESLEKLGPKHGFRVQKEIEDVVPFIKLPKTFDEYLYILTRKNRHELRRKMRRFQKVTEGNWTIKKSTKETLDEDLKIFFKLFRLGNQRKRDFLTKEMERFFYEETQVMQELGMLDFSILLVKNKPAAATIGFFDHKTYYLYNSAFDPKFEYISAGLILKAETIKESVEKGREIYDFMQGNERYKYELGAKDAFVYKITLSCPPTLLLEPCTNSTKGKISIFVAKMDHLRQLVPTFG